MLALITSAVYLVITSLVGLVTAAVVYARWHYGTLEKVKGLPAVIKPAFIGGSDISAHKKIVHFEDIQNVKKYGKIYGVYEGRVPHIYIADPELIRLIFIKDFDHFHSKRSIDFGHEYINDMMDLLPYEKWRPVRNFLSPVFTIGKIRHMTVAMTETIEDWVGALNRILDKGQTFTPRRVFSAMTSDVIARCGFGTRLNSLEEPNNIFVQNLKQLSLEDEETNWMLIAAQTFPFLTKWTPFFPPAPLEFFASILKSVMNTRRANNEKVGDFVDSLNEMMVNAQTDPEYKKVGITESTVICQALVLFIAGFETTATTMSFLTYNLSKNPKIQDKLVAEVDAYLERHNGKIEYETIGELAYMTACMLETLRMFPVLIRVERVCNKDWTHEASGLHISKDMVVQVPVFSVHYNEEYYPDPHTFKPERFMPENKDKLNQYAFLSFGQGPHNCIGQRFAKEEILLAMTNILKNFTFKDNSDTKIKFLPGRTMMYQIEPCTVDAVRRTKK